jgi:hypothetical protein
MSLKPPSWTENPSNFTREEANSWRKWYADPNGSTPHQDIGSRARAVSLAKAERRKAMESSVNELYEQMVRRGVVAAPTKKAKRKPA